MRMGFEYNQAGLKHVAELIGRQRKLAESIASLLAKIKNGYFSGKEVVLQSGLNRTDIEKILDVQSKVEAIGKQIEPVEKAFRGELMKAFNDRKQDLEMRLRQLQAEYKEELRKFPSEDVVIGVVGHGAERDLRDALEEMR
jgi:hypothetical protein